MIKTFILLVLITVAGKAALPNQGFEFRSARIDYVMFLAQGRSKTLQDAAHAIKMSCMEIRSMRDTWKCELDKELVLRRMLKECQDCLVLLNCFHDDLSEIRLDPHTTSRLPLMLETVKTHLADVARNESLQDFTDLGFSFEQAMQLPDEKFVGPLDKSSHISCDALVTLISGMLTAITYKEVAINYRLEAIESWDPAPYI